MKLECGLFRVQSAVGLYTHGKGEIFLLSSLDRSSIAFLVDGRSRPICMECDVGSFCGDPNDPGSDIFVGEFPEGSGKEVRLRFIKNLKIRLHDLGIEFVFARVHTLVWHAPGFTVLDGSLRGPILKRLREREKGLQIPSLDWRRCR